MNTIDFLPSKASFAQPVLLKNITWQTYEAILKDLAEQAGYKITYDCGLLEIMPPLDLHEESKKLLGRFVETISEELDTNIRSLGSRTCKRKDLLRGFEPDQCYYIQNEDLVWDKEQIDLEKDPPPDLIIEIDITSSSISNLKLYAAFGIPEVWRYDGSAVEFYQLEAEEYIKRDSSLAFSFLQPTEVQHFLVLRKTTKETPLMKQFRAWVRSRIKNAEGEKEQS